MPIAVNTHFKRSCHKNTNLLAIKLIECLQKLNELFNKDGTGLNRIPHDNPHHTYSIGQHCLATYKQLASTSK